LDISVRMQSEKKTRPTLSIRIPSPAPSPDLNGQERYHGEDIKTRNQLSHIMTKLTFKLWYKSYPHTLQQSEKLSSFIRSLLRNSRINAHTVVLALYYLQQLVNSIPEQHDWAPQAGSELRMVITALMLADTKVNNNPISLQAWSQAAWLDTAILARMKTEFLNSIKWNLDISTDVYQEWLVEVGRMMNE